MNKLILLLALLILPARARAYCVPTTGPLALSKILLGDPGTTWVGCVNSSLDMLSAAAVSTSAAVGAGACTLPQVMVAGNAGAPPTCAEPSNITGNAPTATALAAAGSAAPANYVCRGVDASGNCLTAAVDAAVVSGSTNPVQGAPVYTALAGKAPLTGAGTSGTWPISISGNAATANSATSAATATALAAAGSAAPANYVCRGVDASGNCLTAAVDAAVVSGSTNPVQGAPVYTALAGKAPLTGGGTSGTWPISISYNAATVTNGLYSTGSYLDPVWLTGISGSIVSGNIPGNSSNVTGTVAIANGGTGATTAATAAANLVNGNPIAPSQITLGSSPNQSTINAAGASFAYGVNAATATISGRLNVGISGITINNVAAGQNGSLVFPNGEFIRDAAYSSNAFQIESNGFPLNLHGGNVGIGTASPATSLDVNGNFQWASGVAKSTGAADGSLSVSSNVYAAKAAFGPVIGPGTYPIMGFGDIALENYGILRFEDASNNFQGFVGFYSGVLSLTSDGSVRYGFFQQQGSTFNGIDTKNATATLDIESPSGTYAVKASSGLVYNDGAGAGITTTGGIRQTSQGAGCAQYDSSGNLTSTGGACGSGSGNMSTSGVNNMASGSAINFGGGSSVTVHTAGLADVPVFLSSQTFTAASSVSFGLAGVSASSPTVSCELSGIWNTTAGDAELTFNGDSGTYYQYIGYTQGQGAAGGWSGINVAFMQFENYTHGVGRQFDIQFHYKSAGTTTNIHYEETWTDTGPNFDMDTAGGVWLNGGYPSYATITASAGTMTGHIRCTSLSY